MDMCLLRYSSGRLGVDGLTTEQRNARLEEIRDLISKTRQDPGGNAMLDGLQYEWCNWMV